MTKINYIFVFIFLFTSLSFAQLTVQDQESSPNTLLQVVDEGTVGSIFLPLSTASIPSSNKLYNLNGTLIWNGSPLGTSTLGWWLD